MKTAGENEANRFSFVLNMLPPPPPGQGQGQWKWYKKVEIIGAYVYE